MRERKREFRDDLVDRTGMGWAVEKDQVGGESEKTID